ncbi:MAG: ArsR/SmtB family transcription factor [Xanthobacter sp.]
MRNAGIDDIVRNADQAAAFLGGLASPHRLRILCQLVEGEKSVSQLIAATGLPQTSMSQHLGKLKDEGIVTFRREHRTLYYSICNEAAIGIIRLLRGQYCDE